LDEQKISYSLSGKDLGIAFEDFVREDWVMYPAMSLGPSQKVSVNFGGKPFAYVFFPAKI
jgi:hypothetical protein